MCFPRSGLAGSPAQQAQAAQAEACGGSGSRSRVGAVAQERKVLAELGVGGGIGLAGDRQPRAAVR